MGRETLIQEAQHFVTHEDTEYPVDMVAGLLHELAAETARADRLSETIHSMDKAVRDALGIGESGAGTVETIEALVASSDREAAARQEAERERDALRVERDLARNELKITGLSRDCLGRFYADATAERDRLRVRRFYADATAERDRLRAELAALRG